MRAMLLHHTAPITTAPLRLEDVADPDPAPGEVLIRVRVCAICRTDLHIIEGDLPEAARPAAPLKRPGASGEGARRQAASAANQPRPH